MKFFTSQLAFFLKTATTRRNIRLLAQFVKRYGSGIVVDGRLNAERPRGA